MKNTLIRTSAIAAITMMTAGIASAQTTVTLENSSQSTTLTANVSEQARVVVPAGVTFNVADISASTAASAASVTIDNIVLASAAHRLKVSLKANAESFTPSVAEAATWDASAVSWNAATFSNAGVSASGSLANNLDFGAIVTCAADVAACSTADLVFTLAANTAVKRSGNHTLAMTWKFESLTP